MTARKNPLFFENAGRNGHLFDHLTSYVSFGPGSYEEMNVLGATIWRYLYPYQVMADIREAHAVCPLI